MPYKPGDLVPVSGIYTVEHDPDHHQKHDKYRQYTYTTIRVSATERAALRGRCRKVNCS